MSHKHLKKEETVLGLGLIVTGILIIFSGIWVGGRSFEVPVPDYARTDFILRADFMEGQALLGGCIFVVGLIFGLALIVAGAILPF